MTTCSGWHDWNCTFHVFVVSSRSKAHTWSCLVVSTVAHISMNEHLLINHRLKCWNILITCGLLIPCYEWTPVNKFQHRMAGNHMQQSRRHTYVLFAARQHPPKAHDHTHLKEIVHFLGIQGLVNVPFWGFVSHHLQISVGIDIPNSWVMWNIGTFTNPWYFFGKPFPFILICPRFAGGWRKMNENDT